MESQKRLVQMLCQHHRYHHLYRDSLAYRLYQYLLALQYGLEAHHYHHRYLNSLVFHPHQNQVHLKDSHQNLDLEVR